MSKSSAPVGIRPTTPYLPELESLRGLAIVLVYTFHLDRFVVNVLSQIEASVVTPWQAFIRAGNTGVSLFFVLSGFLLSLPFVAQAAQSRRGSAGHFYLRRALRILPLYYAAVLVGAVLCAERVTDLWHGVPYLFFLNAFAGIAPLLYPYSSVWWSLVTEVQFYVLLPLLPLLLGSRRGRRIGVAITLLYAVAYGAFLSDRVRMATIGGELHLSLSLFGRAPQFLAGIAAAWSYYHFGTRVRQSLAARWWVRGFAADGAFLALVGALAMLLQWSVAQRPALHESPPYQCWHVAEGGCWAAILWLLLVAPLRIKPIFCNPVLDGLGVLSYSIYMWHVPILILSLSALRHRGMSGLWGWHPQSAVVAAGLSAATLGVSALTYRYIERPFLIRKARID
jgi:peptidoglycan/LPS O-acetylase OafA/YrhL